MSQRLANLLEFALPNFAETFATMHHVSKQFTHDSQIYTRNPFGESCPAYQEKMLDIIQIAFGDLCKFNDSVRSILQAIDWMRTCPREWMASPLSQTSNSMAFPVGLGSPKTPSVFPAVPDDSPIPSLPSPRGKATRRQRSPATPPARPWPGSPISLAASPVPSIGCMPEDSPVPSMPSPKEYQWLN